MNGRSLVRVVAPMARAVAVTILSAALLTACGGSRFSTPTSLVPSARGEKNAGWTPRDIVVPLTGVTPAQLDAARAAGGTIPYFEGSIKSGLNGKTYEYKIVGADPSKSSGTTYVQYVPIVIVITYPDGTVLDPTKPACGDSVSVEQRFLKGPNLVPTDLSSNGVDLGKVQLGDAQQRAEFWEILKSSNYHTVLQAAKDAVVVRVKAPGASHTSKGVCSGESHRVGYFPLDPFITLTRRLAGKYAAPSQIPILLTYNTFQFYPSGVCCIRGFHGAFKRPDGVQAFADGTYNDLGTVAYGTAIADIATMTHEIGETLNDPFVLGGKNAGANKVPAWGHVGEFLAACSNLLEVGDPLIYTEYELKARGFTYHPQELAFFSWFFRTPSIGTGRKYSFNGTFTKTQTFCF